MIFDPKEKLLFVIDKDYYPLILDYKNKHPELNIKIINRSNLIDKAGYVFKKDPLPFLIKEGTEYAKAKRTLNIIRCLRGYQGDTYHELITQLSDYLDVDEYGLLELSRYRVCLLEMDEDEDAKSLLTRNKIPFQILHLSDLDIQKTDSLNNSKIIYFSNKFAQIGHIFADIRQKIKEDESIKERIKILVKDDADAFYIYTIAKLFGIEVYSIDEVPVIANPAVTEMVNKIYQNRSFKDIEQSEELELLNSLIKQYKIDEIDDFDYAYLNLLEILSSQKQFIQHGDRGVVITTSYCLDSDSIWYITNFEYGCFYKEYSDNNVLSDSQLQELNLTTSFNKTALDERKKLNFLLYNHIALLSRVKQHQSDSIYDSQFVDKDIKKRIETKDKIVELNTSGEFTSSMNLLMSAHQYDQHYYYKKNGEYRSYDHSFKGVKANSLMEKVSWSVTNLEKYYNCPFKYLYDELIPLPSDLHHAYRGRFIHSLLENVLHDTYDFEAEFIKAKNVYIKSMEKNKEVFTNKEEAWLEMYRYWLKNIISSIRRIKDNSNIINCLKDAELPVEFDIDGYKFKGYVDKLVYTKNGLDKFYTIVDYKTGAEQYDDMALAVGKSIQLPLYYYALEQFKNKHDYVDDYTFGGFLIQHTYFKSIKAAYVVGTLFSESNLLKQTKYKGINLASHTYAYSFDNTVQEGTTTQKGLFLTGKLTFNKPDDDSTLLSNPPKGLEKFNLNDVVALSKKTAVRIIKAIINNEFDIAPSQTNITKPVKKIDSLNCSFCSHRDICYVNPIEDVRDYSLFIKKELLNKEEDKGE